MYCVRMPTGSKEQPDDFTEALMKVIRAKMGIMQLNIADVSRLTDIPRSTLSRIINTKRLPDLNQIRLIAVALNLPMAQLMGAADDILAGKDPFIP